MSTKIHSVKKYEVVYGDELPISIADLSEAIHEYCELAEIDVTDVVRNGDTCFQENGDYELDVETLELMIEWLTEESNAFPNRFGIARGIRQILNKSKKINNDIVMISIW
jgi:hypothetical protein